MKTIEDHLGLLEEAGFQVKRQQEDDPVRHATWSTNKGANGCGWDIDVRLREQDQLGTLTVTRTGGFDAEGLPMNPDVQTVGGSLEEAAVGALMMQQKSIA